MYANGPLAPPGGPSCVWRYDGRDVYLRGDLGLKPKATSPAFWAARTARLKACP